MSQNIFSWLLFFYTVPAKPGNLRMKVWRRLIKMGAASLKGSVYILPHSEDHLEDLHWLTGEVASLGGGAAFAKVELEGTVNLTAPGLCALYARAGYHAETWTEPSLN